MCGANSPLFQPFQVYVKPPFSKKNIWCVSKNWPAHPYQNRPQITPSPILIVLFFFTIFPFWRPSPVGGPNKFIDQYTSHYDVTYFQGNELDLTITCANMVEMTKQFQNNLFGILLSSLWLLEAAYSWKIRLVQSPSKLRCCLVWKREGRNLAC